MLKYLMYWFFKKIFLIDGSDIVFESSKHIILYLFIFRLEITTKTKTKLKSNIHII